MVFLEYANKSEKQRVKKRGLLLADRQARRDRLVGQRFGKLVVVARYSGTYWECRCDCGSMHVAEGYNLKRSYVRSCGCLRFGPEHRAKMSASAFARHARERGR